MKKNGDQCGADLHACVRGVGFEVFFRLAETERLKRVAVKVAPCLSALR